MRHKFSPSLLAELLGALMVLVILGALAASVWLVRSQETAAWRTQLSNLSLILSEQTSQEVSAAYLILDSITESVQAAGVRTPDELRAKMATAAVHQSMIDKKSALPQIDVATIVASNGDVINFTRAFPAPPINLADRDYFAAHLANPRLGVFISNPVRNKGNGKWTFYLSRRINGPHGEFLGLALVGMSSSFLSSFYQKINLGEGANVTLYRRDFTVLARWPHGEELMGKVNTSGSSYQVIERDKRTDGVVVTSGPRFADGGRAILRMGAPRMVDKYPLIISITVTEDLFLAQSRQFTVLLGLMAACSIVAIGIALRVLLGVLRQREADQATTERLRIEAEGASRAKSEFLAMMSHEIRTPLTAIIGFAELLDNEDTSAGRGDAVQVIVRNGNYLLQIINDILDMSKIEAGHLHLEQVPFSPADVMAGIEPMMRAQAAAKGVAFRQALQAPFPAQVLGDPMRWKQVLFNLCSNAVKFTEHGSVDVSVRYDTEHKRLVCRVADTGIGISEEQRAGLFAPFVQASGDISRKFGGTGLGLHLVQRLTTKMGGTVRFESELGKGSVFEAEIAADLPPDATWLSSMIPLTVPEPAPAPVAALHGKVLLAEDGVDNRKLIGALLARLGVEVSMAENGADAVELALASHFDLVLMDMQMPVMDGLTATTILRAAGFAQPIVALTANVMPEDVQRYLAAGCSHCLGKPIDVAGFVELLSGTLPAAGADQDTPQIEALDDYQDIRRAFAESLPPRLAQMEAHAANDEWRELAAMAHMLKGSAGSFGFVAVGETAAELDSALKRGDHDSALRQLAMLGETIGG